MAGSQPTEAQPGDAEVQLRPDELRGGVDARDHAENRPDDRARGERRDDPVLVVRSYRVRAHVATCGPMPRLQSTAVIPSSVTHDTSRYAIRDEAISIPRPGSVLSTTGRPR